MISAAAIIALLVLLPYFENEYRKSTRCEFDKEKEYRMKRRKDLGMDQEGREAGPPSVIFQE